MTDRLYSSDGVPREGVRRLGGVKPTSRKTFASACQVAEHHWDRDDVIMHPDARKVDEAIAEACARFVDAICAAIGGRLPGQDRKP